MSESEKYMAIERKVYDEIDDFSAEVLNGEELLKYVEARRGFFFNPEETVAKYFTDSDILYGINTYGDFYYHYMMKYSRGYFYKIGETGYTEGFREMLIRYDFDPDIIDIDWESIKNNEERYETDLVDILYSIINYELGKHGMVLFGINMGFESILYFIADEEAYSKRIKKTYSMFTLFDLEFLENIYNEIYEVTEDIGIPKVQKGDFIEKKGNEYSTMFKNKSSNTVIKDMSLENEEKLRLIL